MERDYTQHLKKHCCRWLQYLKQFFHYYLNIIFSVTLYLWGMVWPQATQGRLLFSEFKNGDASIGEETFPNTRADGLPCPLRSKVQLGCAHWPAKNLYTLTVWARMWWALSTVCPQNLLCWCFMRLLQSSHNASYKCGITGLVWYFCLVETFFSDLHLGDGIELVLSQRSCIAICCQQGVNRERASLIDMIECFKPFHSKTVTYISHNNSTIATCNQERIYGLMSTNKGVHSKGSNGGCLLATFTTHLL